MNEKYFTHETALVHTTQIGEGTRIWAFCNILNDAVIGRECNICDHCSIENNVVIGNRVTIKNGVSIWDGMTIEDDVFIGPNAVFTNDVYPRSKVYHTEVDKTLIQQGATIGANAVIIAGHKIGRYSFVGAGAVVTKDVPDFSIWYGNPAIQQGYVCKCTKRLFFTDKQKETVCKCGLKFKLHNDIVSEL